MTAIEWTDVTWNPTRGCSRVSEGCRHCYAETMAARIVRMGKGKPTAYDGLVRIKRVAEGIDFGASPPIEEPRWTGKVAFDADKLAAPFSWKKPRTVFVNSMSDLFHDDVTNEQIAAVFGVMAACPQHTFQVLTKRAKRMREWFAWRMRTAEVVGGGDGQMERVDMCMVESVKAGGNHMRDALMKSSLPKRPAWRWPLPNVWLGVSVENQAAADERIPDLLATPSAVRFLSCEPMLGPIRLDDGESGWLTCTGPRQADDESGCCESRYVNGSCFHGIDWVICGCESGPGARPADVDWYRSLRDQCKAAGVSFFLKQAVAEVRDADPSMFDIGCAEGSKRKPGGVIGLPYLDGVQHVAMPERKS